MSDRQCILVVDDERDILELTSAVLGGAGYVVEAVESGAEAVERLGRESFDLVLLDINMPEMDGWETLRLIRADESLAALPVVMFSVKGELRDKVQGMQEGALDYITKPFVVDTLLARVRRVFESTGGGDASPRSTPAVS
jgi:two-component system response regulator ResD